MPTPDDKRIPEGWVPLTGDDADVNDRLEKIRIGKEKGIVVDEIWYVPSNIISQTNSSSRTQNDPDMHYYDGWTDGSLYYYENQMEQYRRRKRKYTWNAFCCGAFTAMCLFSWGCLRLVPEYLS